MKRSMVWIFGFILVGCISTELVDYWKNPEIDSYHANKILVVGITPNIEARQEFEQKLKQEFILRGMVTEKSLDFLDSTFGNEEKTEEQLNELENKLLEEGFDTIFLTKIIGIENKVAYRDYGNQNESYRSFKDDFYRNQDIYYKPNYYDSYTVYHAETTVYCICPSKNRELIWKGYIDIIDPQSIEETVNDYIKLITAVLEEQQIINSLDGIIESKEAIN